MNINERIAYIIDNESNANKKKFAETIGFAPQVINNIVSGRKSKPSFDVLEAICTSFVDINPQWLLTGEEPIFKKDLNSEQSEIYEILEERKLLYEAIIKSKEEIINAKENHLIEKDVVIKTTERLIEKSESYIETLQEHINMLKLMLNQNKK